MMIRIRCISYLFIVCLALASTAHGESGCRFDYIVDDLISNQGYVEITDRLGPEYTAALQKVLPDFNNAYLLKDHDIIALGWGDIDAVRGVTRYEFTSRYHQLAMSAKEANEDIKSVDVSTDEPYTMYLVKGNASGHGQYEEVGATIVANQSCLLSLVIMPTQDVVLHRQQSMVKIEHLRELIRQNERPLEFASEPSFLNYNATVNAGVKLAAGLIGSVLLFLLYNAYCVLDVKKLTSIMLKIYLVLGVGYAFFTIKSMISESSAVVSTTTNFPLSLVGHVLLVLSALVLKKRILYFVALAYPAMATASDIMYQHFFRNIAAQVNIQFYLVNFQLLFFPTLFIILLLRDTTRRHQIPIEEQHVPPTN